MINPSFATPTTSPSHPPHRLPTAGTLLQPPPPSPAPVVGPQYCIPYPIDLRMVKKLVAITKGNFAVFNSTGSEIFKVKHVFNLIHTKRALVNAARSTIPTFK
ncbi:hypothetical protein NL676_018700 [Syzygium grande]|nr:hypothetical protein NL676_018700 [Syzygium grande]